MRLTIRRQRRATLAAVVNLLLTLSCGVVILGNQWVAPAVSVGWMVAGGVMLIWAGVILSALLRPVLIVADDAGIRLRRLLGWHRFGWADLQWVDLDSARVVMVAARIDGRDRIGGASRRALADADVAALGAWLAARRPDLPRHNPAVRTLQEAT